MATQERIRDLQTDRNRWQSLLDVEVLTRKKLLNDQERGYKYLDENGIDHLPERIAEVDDAVRRLESGLLAAEDLLARALGGEDV